VSPPSFEHCKVLIEHRASLRLQLYGVSKDSPVLVLKKMEDRRQQLQSKIRIYEANIKAAGFIPPSWSPSTPSNGSSDADEDILVQEVLDEYPELDAGIGLEADEEDDELENYMDDKDTSLALAPASDIPKPELYELWLPSHHTKTALPKLCDQELQLRNSQALHALQQVRSGLGEKSVLIRTVVRRNRDAGQYKRGRAWKEVNNAHRNMVKSWRTYERARRAILQLPNSGKLVEIFQPIVRSDLKDMGDITHANRIGQKNDMLPWFWRMKDSSYNDEGWLVEGMCFLS
jgi:hypothetical protein